MSRALAPCGTGAAYNRHIRRGEPPCDACREANTERGRVYRDQLDDYGKRQRVIDGQAASNASRLLRQRHRDEYRALYQAEKRRLAQEARSAARTNPPIPGQTRAKTLATWDNRSAPAGAGNTPRGLTHSLDMSKEGLA